MFTIMFLRLNITGTSQLSPDPIQEPKIWPWFCLRLKIFCSKCFFNKEWMTATVERYEAVKRTEVRIKRARNNEVSSCLAKSFAANVNCDYLLKHEESMSLIEVLLRASQRRSAKLSFLSLLSYALAEKCNHHSREPSSRPESTLCISKN